MEGVAARGVMDLYEYGPLVTFMLLVILGLMWLCRYLIQRNTKQGEKLLEVVEGNTKAMTELKGAIDGLKR
tara:strand:+ start:1394 stop:1606 length:213 start_codon:yes stop_codon:yes gene_type:complete